MRDALLSRLHDNGGDDRYCQNCGIRNPLWFTDTWLWNEVVGGDAEEEVRGILCPHCFMTCAQRVGVTAWRVIPEWSGRAHGLPETSEMGVKAEPAKPTFPADDPGTGSFEAKGAHGTPAPISAPRDVGGGAS